MKTIAAVIFLMLMYSFADAQGNCQGDNIRVYKGATGCGCKCQKECVTPAELPIYLANGWNTVGCWNCCKLKNWVEAEIPKSDVKIQITDMAGRFVATDTDESVLSPGIYFITVEEGDYREVTKITVMK